MGGGTNIYARFIPAGAGNTSPTTPGSGTCSVHPRGCGEHWIAPLSWRYTTGSSPRVRGTPSRDSICHLDFRFIPAGAGNTLSKRGCYMPSAVHPRGCGEHDFLQQCLLHLHGSSPRVRGTRDHSRLIVHLARFIPAGAGNTRRPRQDRGRPAVHPRGCGEHRLMIPAGFRTDGSSPRVRGTLEHFKLENYHIRMKRTILGRRWR